MALRRCWLGRGRAPIKLRVCRGTGAKRVSASNGVLLCWQEAVVEVAGVHPSQALSQAELGEETDKGARCGLAGVDFGEGGGESR